MWTATLDALTALDIADLVENETEESSSLEYKEQLPSGGDEDTREFLYDVAALANGGGGYLVFGIKDRRDTSNKPTGVADEIVGIPDSNLASDIARLENKIRDGIASRLNGIQTKAILCGSKRVLVLAIPQSWNAPHMVTFKGTNKFYGRVSTGKYPMSVDQIRTAFTQQSSLRDAIQTWRTHRTSLIENGGAPVELQSGPTAIITVIPVSAFTLQSSLSTWKLSEQVRLKMHCPSVSFSGSGRYNGDGYLKFAEAGPNQPVTGYTQVFRNGIIEYVTASFSWDTDGKLTEKSQIFIRLVEQELVKSFRDAKTILTALELKEPVYVAVNLIGLKGRSMYVGPRSFSALKIMRNDAFTSPEVLVESDDDSDLPTPLKILADLMWQAGGLESTPCMTGGEWTPMKDS